MAEAQKIKHKAYVGLKTGKAPEITAAQQRNVPEGW
jgi:hypothetical protein